MATTTKRKTATKNTRPRRTALKPKPDTATPLPFTPPEPSAPWWNAVQAMQDKKAEDVKILDLRPVTTFADFMLICSGSNPRQIQAIADEIQRVMEEAGDRVKSMEGYKNAEWILMDYGDYVVNIFSSTARNYYELERLWRDAPTVPLTA